jgi:hypothetical protein
LKSTAYFVCTVHPAGEYEHDQLFYKKLPYDLSFHAGLAFVGKYLKRVNVNPLIDPMSERTGVGLRVHEK